MCLSYWYSILLLFTIQSGLTFGHRCYVCGNENGIGCDQFTTFNKNNFVQDCPNHSRSCSVQKIDNTITTRSCEFVKLDDCKIANNVEYCYCSSNLCNGLSIQANDDEDLNEGSGASISTEIIENVGVTEIHRTKTGGATVISSMIGQFYFSILIVFIFN